MSDNKKPTNGGLNCKAVGGQLVPNEKNQIKMPPEGSTVKGLPKDDPYLEDPNNYVSIQLVPDREQEGPNID